MDLFGNPQKRDAISPFVQLLWEKGSLYEAEVIDNLSLPFLNLRGESGAEREALTYDAMRRREPLIYAGRIASGDLLGDPDLLRLEDGGYVAGDIKSGTGEEDDGSGPKLKKHYGVQIALYTDILERLGFAGQRRPFIWDSLGDEVIYNLNTPIGKRDPVTLWTVYQDALALAQQIVAGSGNTVGAYGSKCKLCHWRSACVEDLEKIDDLTLLPDLGRARRDAIAQHIPTVSALAKTNINRLIGGAGSPFPGVGTNTLKTLHERAQLATNPSPKPYRKTTILLPKASTELFFDIEVDPMRDICYLHGFVERHNNDPKTEKFVSFFVEDISTAEEERVLTEALQYIQSKQPCVLYFYSKYERTWYRNLQERYPSVCSETDIETLFDPLRAVDLYYDVVRKYTEWPTRDFSIKTLANYLGFNWRDTDPSGAASIEWFHRWIETGDMSIKQRILDYNEDDCIATRVLLDGINAL
jgi:predicted RecB family nuclease